MLIPEGSGANPSRISQRGRKWGFYNRNELLFWFGSIYPQYRYLGALWVSDRLATTRSRAQVKPRMPTEALGFRVSALIARTSQARLIRYDEQRFGQSYILNFAVKTVDASSL